MTYETRPVAKSNGGTCGIPFSSTSGQSSKVAIVRATTRYRYALARCIPGHSLVQRRSPSEKNPDGDVQVCTESKALCIPSTETIHQLSRVSLGAVFAREEPLRFECLRVRVVLRVVQHCPAQVRVEWNAKARKLEPRTQGQRDWGLRTTRSP